mmetsp:Transcript_4475/g.11949  ORF Transcript_4475/g.11949 Transcript_4475/m.11949 type:complete len:218 (-) Transcript_4475:242-895(-)
MPRTRPRFSDSCASTRADSSRIAVNRRFAAARSPSRHECARRAAGHRCSSSRPSVVAGSWTSARARSSSRVISHARTRCGGHRRKAMLELASSSVRLHVTRTERETSSSAPRIWHTWLSVRTVCSTSVAVGEQHASTAVRWAGLTKQSLSSSVSWCRRYGICRAFFSAASRYSAKFINAAGFAGSKARPLLAPAAATNCALLPPSATPREGANALPL